MNCKTCNTPHAPHELRDGLCFGCVHRAISNLLAVIHRDGGRYTGIHGLEVSAKSGVEIITRARITNEELQSELAKVNAQAAEMRHALVDCQMQLSELAAYDLDFFKRNGGNLITIHHALSTDAGRGYASPEDVKVLVDCIRVISSHHVMEGPKCMVCDAIDKALAHAKSKGLIQ